MIVLAVGMLSDCVIYTMDVIQVGIIEGIVIGCTNAIIVGCIACLVSKCVKFTIIVGSKADITSGFIYFAMDGILVGAAITTAFVNCTMDAMLVGNANRILVGKIVGCIVGMLSSIVHYI